MALTLLEEFTTKLYGAKAKRALNEYRYDRVEKAFNPKARAALPLLKLKDIMLVASYLAKQRPHAKRAVFLARM